MSSIFPNQLNIAKPLQATLQKIVDDKAEIQNDLYTLALRCNENLKKKIAAMPQPPVQEEKAKG